MWIQICTRPVQLLENILYICFSYFDLQHDMQNGSLQMNHFEAWDAEDLEQIMSVMDNLEREMDEESGVDASKDLSDEGLEENVSAPHQPAKDWSLLGHNTIFQSWHLFWIFSLWFCCAFFSLAPCWNQLIPQTESGSEEQCTGLVVAQHNAWWNSDIHHDSSWWESINCRASNVSGSVIGTSTIHGSLLPWPRWGLSSWTSDTNSTPWCDNSD